MLTHYVLIDYQNVQPTDLSALNSERVRVVVFVGEERSTLRTDFVLALQKFGPRGEIIRLTRQGPNALDFHIAFYLGRLVEQAPTARFHVVSKDQGFDPLLQHLKQRGIHAQRIEDLSGIPLPTVQKSTKDNFTKVVESLERRGTSRPRTLEKLTNTIAALLRFRRSKGRREASEVGKVFHDPRDYVGL
jgi:hypothetical protein